MAKPTPGLSPSRMKVCIVCSSVQLTLQATSSKHKELSVQIDKTKPAFVLTANGEPLADGAVFSDDRSITLLLNASDPLSGIASQELTLDGKRLDNGASVDLAGKLGLHTLKIVITDQTGNKTMNLSAYHCSHPRRIVQLD